MDLHPDVMLLQELQEIHDTGLMQHQKSTCYDIRKQYEKSPQTGRGVWKPTKTKKPTGKTPYIHTTITHTELPTTTYNNSKQNSTPTATRITFRAPSLLKKATNVTNSEQGKEEHPTKSDILKCQYNDCNKTFTKKGYLRRHTMNHIHSDILKSDILKSETFKCQYNECNKTFTKKDYLRRHTMTHINTKIFSCNFERCHKKFNRSDTLSRHRRAHFQTALFECPKCHKNLSRLDNLARHISTKHRSQLK